MLKDRSIAIMLAIAVVLASASLYQSHHKAEQVDQLAHDFQYGGGFQGALPAQLPNLNVNGTTKIVGATGHELAVGPALTSSNLSACGTSPSVSGTDRAGHIVTGGTATTCTLTFNKTYTARPSCTLFTEGSATAPTCTVSATAITCTVAAATTTYDYSCIGEPTST